MVCAGIDRFGATGYFDTDAVFASNRAITAVKGLEPEREPILKGGNQFSRLMADTSDRYPFFVFARECGLSAFGANEQRRHRIWLSSCRGYLE